MSTKQNKLSFWVIVIYVLIWNNFSAFQLSSLYNKNRIIIFFIQCSTVGINNKR